MKHRRRTSHRLPVIVVAAVGTLAAAIAVPAVATADPCPVGQAVAGNLLCEPIFTPGDGLGAPPLPVAPPAPRAPACLPPKVLSGLLCVEIGPPAPPQEPVHNEPTPSHPSHINTSPAVSGTAAPHRATPVPLPRPRPAPPVVRHPVPPPAPVRPRPTPPALTPPAPVESPPSPVVEPAQDCPPPEVLVSLAIGWVPLRVSL
jgi:hypothetical protein